MSYSKMNLVDPELELSDPNPDIHELFMNFNVLFFNNLLGSVEVKWSPRMTLCAGLCRYVGRNGQCSIHLSKPLLTLRSRRDLIETLLHEMIHAYLFVVDRNKERESHGPKFQALMQTINKQSGTNITVHHSFPDQLRDFKVHWWQCDGPCRTQPPNFGIMKRYINKPPGPNDIGHPDHQRKCNGNFNKVKGPSHKKKTTAPKVARKRMANQAGKGSTAKISDIFTKIQAVPTKKKKNETELDLEDSAIKEKPVNIEDTASKFDSPKMQVNYYGIIPFSGKGNSVGGSATLDKRPGPKEHPLLSKWKHTEKLTSTAELPIDNQPAKLSEEPKPGPSKDLTEKVNGGSKEGGQKEHAQVIWIISSDDEDSATITLSSDDEELYEDHCPACGIECRSFSHNLEEHLQGCEMLADW